MQANKIKQFITSNNDGSFELEIDVSDKGITVAGATVQRIGMYIAADEDDGDGDLYVAWDETGMDDDAIGAVMDAFYSEGEFNEALAGILQDCGFSAEASEVYGSESGMQDEGRASYDAYEIADEVRQVMEAITA